MSPDAHRRLAPLAAQLPFELTDTDAATAAFVRWAETGDADAHRHAQIWAYAFVQGYFLSRFAYERGAASDFDAVVETAFRRILGRFDAIEHPDRFVHYVRRACKNVLRNHRRDRHGQDDLEERHLDPVEPEPVDAFDGPRIRRIIGAAIEALPDSMREVTRLRLLDDLSYAEIEAQTGVPLASARTFTARGMRRLREDPTIRALRYDDLLPPPPETSNASS